MITIDDKNGVVHILREDGSVDSTLPLSDPAAFEIVAKHWLRATWDAKYVYSFTWLGRPVIQLPDDLLRLQELIFEVRPDVIIETGVAHGGSLIFHATVLKALGRGRVIGVDVDIRAHNRKAIEEHILFDLITLIEGDSTAASTVNAVKNEIREGETVLVILDSMHTKDHVRKELEAYGQLVSPGSYVLAADGIMEQVAGAPRTSADWRWNNPKAAVREFLEAHAEFEPVAMQPALFNEGSCQSWVTYFPGGLIRRVAPTDHADTAVRSD